MHALSLPCRPSLFLSLWAASSASNTTELSMPLGSGTSLLLLSFSIYWSQCSLKGSRVSKQVLSRSGAQSDLISQVVRASKELWARWYSFCFGLVGGGRCLKFIYFYFICMGVCLHVCLCTVCAVPVEVRSENWIHPRNWSYWGLL